MQQPAATPADHRPQLDALRAFAVIAVLLDHFWPQLPPFGHEGVRLFFVLSGFLITSALLDIRTELDRHPADGSRWTMLKRFYGRRILRIFPAYYLTLLLLTVLGNAAVRHDLLVDALHGHNLLLAWRERWSPFATIHLWSLSLEEQFYLVWPLVVLFAPRRAIGWAIAACVLSAPAFRAAALAAGVDQGVAIWVLPPSSLDALGFGALLAALRHSSRWLAVMRRAGLGTALVALPIVAAHRLGWLELSAVTEIVVLEWLLALVFAAIVLAAAEGFGGATGRVLMLSPLRYLGRISYGVYLYHLPVFFFIQKADHVAGLREPPPGALRFALSTALTLAVAACSWHLMESPINRLKRFLPYRIDAKPQPRQALLDSMP